MPNMEIERFRELCAAYFLDDLSEQESKEFRVALDSSDKELIKIFTQFQSIYLHLPLVVENNIPSSFIKEDIFKSINRKQVVSHGLFEEIVNFLKIGNPRIAFSLTVVLIIGMLVLSYFAVMQSKIISNQNVKIVELTGQVEKDAAILQVIEAKQFEVTILNGLSVDPKGYGKIMWDPAKKSAVLQISNLPATQPDKDYQLWVIKNNKPISNGVFSIKRGDQKFFKVTSLVESDKNQINAFAITLEPKGGVPQPTGAMYLMGLPSQRI